MKRPGREDSLIPRLDVLGPDLLRTTRRQCWIACMRPFAGIALFALAVTLGWWWLTPIASVVIVIAVVTVTHDVVHGALGLGRRQTEWALFLFGAVLLESGHAFRVTHLQHHRAFPKADDPEGDAARMTFWAAVLHGPVFLPRLWWWAYQRSPNQRRWLLLEAAWAIVVPLAGALLWPWTPAILVYAILVIAGGWCYPLLTVHLPHRDYGDHALTHAGSLRGRLVPALFLEQTYHLEHHLFPTVPSHGLPELARRLDPYLRAAGIEPHRVP